MRFIRLEGSPRDRGRQHGAAFAGDIKKYYEWYCARTGKTPDKLKPSIKKYVESNFPQIAEEMEGIALGAGMRYEEILVYNHFNVISGCTPIFFRNSECGPLLAQNLDCEPEELDAVVVRNVVPASGQACLSASFVGTVWCSNFINQAGIAKTGVSAHHHPYRRDDGTSGGIISSAIAGNAGTLEEAFEIAARHRWIGKVGVLFFADADGRAMHLEGDADRKWKVEIKDDFAFSTGLFITGNVVAQNQPKYLRPKHARQETIDNLYRTGQIEFTLDGMKKLQAHHAPDPGSVCRHNRDEGSCTQSARIFIIRERKLLITVGPPCTASYKEFTLEC